MNMKRKILLVTGVMMLLLPHAFSQFTEIPLPSGDEKMIPEVNGNSSISNIDQPNLFDGSTTVNIPIFNFSNNYGSYGVGFTYNTKGIQVDQIASPIGLNWNMNIGYIQRVVKHLPDETFEPVGSEDESDTTNALGRLAYSLSSYTSPQQHSDANTKVLFDDAFDDFIVSVPGLSFTFNIGKDGFLFTHPQKHVTIDLLLDGAPVDTIPVASSGSIPGELGFLITDARGIRYHFQKNVYGANSTYVQSWYLSKVVFPDLSEIRYYYINQGGTVRSMQDQYVVNHNDGNTGTYTPTNRTSVLPSVPDSIVFPNNVTVSFKYRNYTGTGLHRCDVPGGLLLDEVRVRSSKKVQRYILNQSYVQSVTGTVSGKESPCASMSSLPAGHYADWYFRLLLTSIWLSNADGSELEQYYTFDYNNILLPHRMSGAKDFFGYYNGNTLHPDSLTMSIPRHKNIYGGTGADSFGVNRQYNPDYAKAGLLYRVKKRIRRHPGIQIRGACPVELQYPRTLYRRLQVPGTGRA